MANDIPLFSLEPRQLARFLTDHGWRVESYRNAQRFWLPEESDNEEIEVFLSHTARSNSDDVRLILETLSELYQRPAQIILNEIKSLGFDLIAGRIPDDYVKNDSIELRLATEFISKMKTFLAASATTEISGTRSYKRLLKDAQEYSENCRFGHTFRGSFGFLIESPVGLNDAPTLEGVPEELPLGRLVVERITMGLMNYSQAVELEDPSVIVNEAQGFSANMCDTIINIVEVMDVTKIAFDITMSPEWRPRHGQRENHFSVEAKHLDLLKDASKALRVDEKPRDVEIVGRIKRLETEANPSDLFENTSNREIEVNWLNEDGDVAHVKISLNPEQYLAAVEAHRSGKFVSALGSLERSGRGWRLKKVTKFGVVGQEQGGHAAS